jgi:hypothetical protein
MSSYSPDLRIELIDAGAQAGTWGTTTNNTFAYLLEAAIAGYQTVSVTSASQALTYINGASSTVADNQSVYAMLRFTTTTGAAFNVYAPPASKQYIVWNDSGYSMIIYNSTTIGNTTAAGTGITITNGTKVMVWSDGTNFNELQAASITGTLAINKGGTGQVTANAAFNALAPAQTANRLLKSDGTNTSFAQAVLTTDVTGTLPVANGGTGTTSTTFANLTTNVTGTLPIANGGTGVTTLTALGNLFYPVGSIYSSTVSTNPGTSLGFGTWTQFGAGRMMMGAGGSFSPGATGGSNDAIVVSHAHTYSSTSGGQSVDHSHTYSATTGGQSADHSHTGTTNGAGSHSHTYDDAYMAFFSGSVIGAASTYNTAGYQFRSPTPSTSTIGDHTHSFTTGGVSAGHTHNVSGTTSGVSVTHTHAISGTTDANGSSGTNANLPPYIVVYMWQRTA